MWPMAVLASALVRPVVVLTAAVPGGYGGGEGEGGGGEGGGGEGGSSEGGSIEGEGSGGEGGGGEGGGPKQVEIMPLTPVRVRVVGQEQTVPELKTYTWAPQRP